MSDSPPSSYYDPIEGHDVYCHCDECHQGHKAEGQIIDNILDYPNEYSCCANAIDGMHICVKHRREKEMIDNKIQCSDCCDEANRGN